MKLAILLLCFLLGANAYFQRGRRVSRYSNYDDDDDNRDDHSHSSERYSNEKDRGRYDDRHRYESRRDDDRSHGNSKEGRSTWRDKDRNVDRDRHSWRDKDRNDSRERHRNSWRDKDRNNDSKERHWRDRKHLYRTEILMPNGNKANITDPPYSKNWHYGEPATKRTLSPDGKMSRIEYNIVKDQFNAAFPGVVKAILKIEKITNIYLWKNYRYNMQQMNDTIPGGVAALNEQMLFYGNTAANLVEKIDKGFDVRELTITSSVGGAAYCLSKLASEADAAATAQADGSKVMLMCRVVPGKEQVSGAIQIAHPAVGHNSLKINNQYCIYRGEQIYPEYMIQYK